jgi:helicase associated protein
MSKMLVLSPEFGCSQEILTIVAMLSGAFSFASCVDETDCIPCSPQHLGTTELPAERGGYGEATTVHT